MRVSVNGLIESVGWCVSRRMVVRMTGSWMERFDLWRLSSFSDETRWESNRNSAAIIPCFKILFVCLFVFWHFRCCFCCRWRCCCSCERDRVWLRPHWEVQASGNNVDLLSDRLEYSLILGCAGVVIGRDYLLRSSADFSTRFISSSCDFLYFLLLLLRFFMKGGGANYLLKTRLYRSISPRTDRNVSIDHDIDYGWPAVGMVRARVKHGLLQIDGIALQTVGCWKRECGARERNGGEGGRERVEWRGLRWHSMISSADPLLFAPMGDICTKPMTRFLRVFWSLTLINAMEWPLSAPLHVARKCFLVDLTRMGVVYVSENGRHEANSLQWPSFFLLEISDWQPCRIIPFVHLWVPVPLQPSSIANIEISVRILSGCHICL